MDFTSVINTAAYDFFRENPRLGSRIMLLGVSGSYGYGTNREDSDIDFRGVTLNQPSDLIGLTRFEQYEDPNTDTVIYSFNKFIELILNCNPNTIEILGLDPDQYVIISPLGQELLDHKALFLTKRAAVSFGHYATAQLRRLQNALARDKMPQSQREAHMLNSVRYCKAAGCTVFTALSHREISLQTGFNKKKYLILFLLNSMNSDIFRRFNAICDSRDILIIAKKCILKRTV